MAWKKSGHESYGYMASKMAKNALVEPAMLAIKLHGQVERITEGSTCCTRRQSIAFIVAKSCVRGDESFSPEIYPMPKYQRFSLP